MVLAMIGRGVRHRAENGEEVPYSDTLMKKSAEVEVYVCPTRRNLRNMVVELDSRDELAPRSHKQISPVRCRRCSFVAKAVIAAAPHLQTLTCPYSLSAHAPSLIDIFSTLLSSLTRLLI